MTYDTVMRSFTYAILFASVSLVVAFRTGRATLREGHAQHARRVQARSSMQYNLVDHYSAQDFMNERCVLEMYLLI